MNTFSNLVAMYITFLRVVVSLPCYWDKIKVTKTNIAKVSLALKSNVVGCLVVVKIPRNHPFVKLFIRYQEHNIRYLPWFGENDASHRTTTDDLCHHMTSSKYDHTDGNKYLPILVWPVGPYTMAFYHLKPFGPTKTELWAKDVEEFSITCKMDW